MWEVKIFFYYDVHFSFQVFGSSEGILCMLIFVRIQCVSMLDAPFYTWMSGFYTFFVMQKQLFWVETCVCLKDDLNTYIYRGLSLEMMALVDKTKQFFFFKWESCESI